MILKQCGIMLGYLLLAAGDTVPKVAPWAQLGAAGLLATILIFVIRDNAVARKERCEEREAERQVLNTIHNRLHDDSEKLNETLRDMMTHCATVHQQQRHQTTNP
ncbi:MAG: hypothetical protein GX616_27595 [Planctomycetes bacterium]|nr:hypothetical protein [Planctomycetota bacterium]